MRCVRCHKDSKLRERPGRICPGCREPFAFEPRNGDPMTDMAFADAIDRVSSGGEVWWGVEHLYYEVARRIVRKKRSKTKGMLIVLAVMAIGGLLVHPIIGLLFSGAIAAVWVSGRRKTVPIDRHAFADLWSRWESAHGKPRRVIVRKKSEEIPARTLDADIASYSFDRAVICDRARTVDLLLANNFHFENNCAVLSVDGYPDRAFDVVRQMLKNNPRLQVFALHDATPGGCALADHVANAPEWFDRKVSVVDVGLRPAHAQPYAGLWIAREPPSLRTDGLAQLTARERRWLTAGWVLELAAIPPEQVIKRLFRAIATGAAEGVSPVADGGGTDFDGGVVLWSAGSGLDTDATASDGGGDSFG